MGVSVRPAEAGDAAVAAGLLYDFNREFGDPTPPPEQLALRLVKLLAAGDTVILLAGRDGEDPCAVAVMRFRLSIWEPDLECYLAELYVAPARRGHGIGRALMEAAMAAAREQGAGYMDLGTAETDVAARALYESLGFNNHERRPGGPVNYFYERDL